MGGIRGIVVRRPSIGVGQTQSQVTLFDTFVLHTLSVLLHTVSGRLSQPIFIIMFSKIILVAAVATAAVAQEAAYAQCGGKATTLILQSYLSRVLIVVPLDLRSGFFRFHHLCERLHLPVQQRVLLAVPSSQRR